MTYHIGKIIGYNDGCVEGYIVEEGSNQQYTFSPNTIQKTKPVFKYNKNKADTAIQSNKDVGLILRKMDDVGKLTNDRFNLHYWNKIGNEPIKTLSLNNSRVFFKAENKKIVTVYPISDEEYEERIEMKHIENQILASIEKLKMNLASLNKFTSIPPDELYESNSISDKFNTVIEGQRTTTEMFDLLKQITGEMKQEKLLLIIKNLIKGKLHLVGDKKEDYIKHITELYVNEENELTLFPLWMNFSFYVTFVGDESIARECYGWFSLSLCKQKNIEKLWKHKSAYSFQQQLSLLFNTIQSLSNHERFIKLRQTISNAFNFLLGSVNDINRMLELNYVQKKNNFIRKHINYVNTTIEQYVKDPLIDLIKSLTCKKVDSFMYESFNREINIQLSSLLNIDRKQYELVEHALNELLPNPSVGEYKQTELYGSYKTGLLIEGSDIDLFVESIKERSNPKNLLHTLQYVEHTIKQSDQFTIEEKLYHTRIPLLKIKHVSGIEVDISVKSRLGIMNSNLISAYLNLMPVKVQTFVKLVKLWAKRRGIANAHKGTLSAYCYVLMTLAFLQSIHLIPNLQKFNEQDDLCGDFSDHSDCRFLNLTTYQTPKFIYMDNALYPIEVGTLFGLFFKFYNEYFDHNKHCVSIRHGGIITRPSHFHSDYQIEDPFNGRDLGQTLKGGARVITKVFRSQYYSLIDFSDDGNPELFLKCFKKRDEVDKYAYQNSNLKRGEFIRHENGDQYVYIKEKNCYIDILGHPGYNIQHGDNVIIHTINFKNGSIVRVDPVTKEVPCKIVNIQSKKYAFFLDRRFNQVRYNLKNDVFSGLYRVGVRGRSCSGTKKSVLVGLENFYHSLKRIFSHDNRTILKFQDHYKNPSLPAPEYNEDRTETHIFMINQEHLPNTTAYSIYITHNYIIELSVYIYSIMLNPNRLKYLNVPERQRGFQLFQSSKAIRLDFTLKLRGKKLQYIQETQVYFDEITPRFLYETDFFENVTDDTPIPDVQDKERTASNMVFLSTKLYRTRRHGRVYVPFSFLTPIFNFFHLGNQHRPMNSKTPKKTLRIIEEIDILTNEHLACYVASILKNEAMMLSSKSEENPKAEYLRQNYTNSLTKVEYSNISNLIVLSKMYWNSDVSKCTVNNYSEKNEYYYNYGMLMKTYMTYTRPYSTELDVIGQYQLHEVLLSQTTSTAPSFNHSQFVDMLYNCKKSHELDIIQVLIHSHELAMQLRNPQPQNEFKATVINVTPTYFTVYIEHFDYCIDIHPEKINEAPINCMKYDMSTFSMSLQFMNSIGWLHLTFTTKLIVQLMTTKDNSALLVRNFFPPQRQKIYQYHD